MPNLAGVKLATPLRAHGNVEQNYLFGIFYSGTNAENPIGYPFEVLFLGSTASAARLIHVKKTHN